MDDSLVFLLEGERGTVSTDLPGICRAVLDEERMMGKNVLALLLCMVIPDACFLFFVRSLIL
jgi:hypothetical protein